MMIEDLKGRICDHLFGETLLNEGNFSKLFKKHSQNLKENGDLSFPLKYEIWENRTLLQQNCETSGKVTENCKKLIKKSKEWPITIEKVDFKNNRCVLYLNKHNVMKIIFSEVLESSSYGKLKLKHDFRVIIPNINNDLTNWRSKLIALTVNNVLNFCISENIGSDCYVEFLSNGSKNHIRKNTVVYCGIVINASTKKKTNFTYEDYFWRKDMQLIAMHKYGIRMENNPGFSKFLDKLGEAAVVVDLLEAKHTSPVRVVESQLGSSKGASFILYNCARLETLLKMFGDRVKQQFYSELPNLTEIDITNLKEEEEWQLVYNYILTFPDMVCRVLDNLESGHCAPHLIPQFLNGLVSLFSIYYRRVKILVDNREHLSGNLFARIYLLKCIQKILKICLEFIDIEPIHKM